jgi:hypothetical protein
MMIPTFLQILLEVFVLLFLLQAPMLALQIHLIVVTQSASEESTKQGRSVVGDATWGAVDGAEEGLGVGFGVIGVTASYLSRGKEEKV